MQQVDRYDDDNPEGGVEKGVMNKPRRRSAQRPPDAYIHKVHQAVRFKKAPAADAHGDAPQTYYSEEEGKRKQGKKGRTIRRLRHRKNMSKHSGVGRSPSVEDRQVQADVDDKLCEAHCKVARKNSALYNVSETPREPVKSTVPTNKGRPVLSEHLKYGVTGRGRPVRSTEQTPRPTPILKKEAGKDRKLSYPQGSSRNSMKPRDANAKKQVLKLSSSQIMHLDIKPRGIMCRRQPFCPMPSRKNKIQRKTPHFVLLRRSSPLRQHWSNGHHKGEVYRYPNTLKQIPNKTILKCRGSRGGFIPRDNPSRLIQLFRVLTPQQRSLARNIISKQLKVCKHQPRDSKRISPPIVKGSAKTRSSSLHSSYYATPRSNMAWALPRNHSIPRRPHRIGSVHSIDVIGIDHMRQLQERSYLRPTVPSHRATPYRPVTTQRDKPRLSRATLRDRTTPIPRSISVRTRPSMFSSAPTSLRENPSMYSSAKRSMRGRPSIMSSPNYMHDANSRFSSAPTFLRDRPSQFSSGRNSQRDRPCTTYGTTLLRNRSVYSARPETPYRSNLYHQMPRPNAIQLRPPVPSRAQTTINAQSQPNQGSGIAMRDLLNNLKDSSQLNLERAAAEQQNAMNNVFKGSPVIPGISLRPFRKSANLSSYCSYDVLPERDEEEIQIQNLEKTASSNTTYSMPPNYCKINSTSTQTMIGC